MQGIETLAPQMNMAAPPQQEPQVPMAAVKAVDSMFRGLTPELTQQLKSISEMISQLPPEELNKLLQIIEFLRQNKQNYAQAVQQLIAQGMVNQGDLPPEYSAEYLSVLSNVVKKQMQGATAPMQPPMAPPMAQMQPPIGMAQGGIANLPQMAQKLQDAGRYGDTVLAHVNPQEMAMLRARGGSGTINPKTGLHEFFNFKSVFKVATQIILPVVFGASGLGPIAGAAVGSGLASLINGDKPADALKSALIGGATGAALSGISGMISSDATGITGAFKGILPNVGSASGEGFLAGIQAGLPSGLGLSGQYAMERSILPSFLGGSEAKTIGTPAETPLTETPRTDQPVKQVMGQPVESSKPISYDPGDATRGVADTTANSGGAPAPQQQAAGGGGGAPKTGVPSALDSATDKIKNILLPSDPSPTDPAIIAKAKAIAESTGVTANQALALAMKQATPGLMSYLPLAAVAAGGAAAFGLFDTPKTTAVPTAASPQFSGPTANELIAANPEKYVTGPGNNLPDAAKRDAGFNPYQFIPYQENFTPTSKQVAGANYTPVRTANSPIMTVEDLNKYFNNPKLRSPMRAAKGGITDLRMSGGHLNGPGTGTSDSIPAKLSDGEFVMTAKAVRGMGNGSRIQGAKKMYKLMHKLEARA